MATTVMHIKKGTFKGKHTVRESPPFMRCLPHLAAGAPANGCPRIGASATALPAES